MAGAWSREEILEIARGYQPACVLAAAAELDVFGALDRGPMSAPELARRLDADGRGIVVLLDALAALSLLDKRDGVYSVPSGVAAALGGAGERSVLAMARHQANCLRRWALLARVVRSGRPAERVPSVRGEAADLESFVLAMDDVSRPVADEVVRRIEPLAFRCLLDVGGGPGTWTAAFLRAWPPGRAILFDVPEAIPLARRSLETAGLAQRVTLVGGDFHRDALPGGADLAWVSAIVHQHSRAENRELFRKVGAALAAGGRIAIRDILMEPSRTEPVAGALFAVNMLVGTEAGGTYTVEELVEDLEAAGFRDAAVLHREPTMSSILAARKR